MFENQPKGLFALALANTGERFGYYTMIAIFVLFLKANFGFSPAVAGNIYAVFLSLVYFDVCRLLDVSFTIRSKYGCYYCNGGCASDDLSGNRII